MKNNVSHVTPRFVDYPLTNAALPVYPASSLRLLSTSETDFADTALRFFLMLCLLASLALCGLQSSLGTSHPGENAAPLLPAWSQVVPHVPAVPAVAFCSLAR